MIFWFSGTGNSKFVAEKIANATGDELVSLNTLIKSNQHAAEHAAGASSFDSGQGQSQGQNRLVFVVPTYAWRIPKLVQKWIEEAEFEGFGKAYFVMSCGGEIGGAEKYNKLLCDEKHWEYMGTAQIVMPENYIAMFSAPQEPESRKIVEAAIPDIQRCCELIKNGQKLPATRNNLYDKMMSDIVNPIFYRLFVKANAFRADARCVSCDKCVELCPLNNIKLVNGRPVWGRDCSHCMACICSCPTGAIEYGKKSVGQPRYHCPEI